MNPLLSSAILVMITVTGIILVLGLGKPIIDSATDLAQIQESETLLRRINNYIIETASEGNGSSRFLSFYSPAAFEVYPQDDSIVAEFKTPYVLSRKYPIMYLSGSDANCTSGGNLTIENSKLKAVFQYVQSQQPFSSINTANNIVYLEEKSSNSRVYTTNSSVRIDGLPTSSYGNGYSEVMRTGNNLPFCRVHFYINSISGIKYDIFYTLYSGSDFIEAAVNVD